MEFHFNHLGNIDSGTVELGNLTVICGPNSVGKTYISYTIYGIIRFFHRLINLSLSNEKLSELRKEGTVVIDLKEYITNISHYLNQVSDDFSNDLDEYFNTNEGFFQNSVVQLNLKNFQPILSNEFKDTTQFGKKESILFNKETQDDFLTITLQTEDVDKNLKVPNSILNQVISSRIASCLFAHILPKPFVITSERTGISLFYKELDISKNAILEHLSVTDKVNPIELLNIMRSRYAQPIHDNINIIRDYDNLSKKKSFIKENSEKYKHISDLLSDLMGGTYKSIDRQIMFVPKKEKNRDRINVPVYIASSSIKSLFLIDMYINHLAVNNGLLIIDEPELNLHPDNQRKMAGLLSQLVNTGVKVLITTHSDYLIRELNNRIMLSSDIVDKDKIMKDEKISHHEILKPQQVKAYALDGSHAIKNITVDKFGMDLEIFDCLIEKSNNLSNTIYYGMKNDAD